MTRKEKLKLINDIATGQKDFNELLPKVRRTWIQDEKDFGLFHCKEEGLTKRWDELPYKIEGSVIDHLVMCLYGPVQLE